LCVIDFGKIVHNYFTKSNFLHGLLRPHQNNVMLYNYFLLAIATNLSTNQNEYFKYIHTKKDQVKLPSKKIK